MYKYICSSVSNLPLYVHVHVHTINHNSVAANSHNISHRPRCKNESHPMYVVFMLYGVLPTHTHIMCIHVHVHTCTCTVHVHTCTCTVHVLKAGYPCVLYMYIVLYASIMYVFVTSVHVHWVTSISYI